MLPNKQKLPIFLKGKMSSFRMCNTQALLATMVAARVVARHMHCLQLVSEFWILLVIPTFPKTPIIPTVLSRKDRYNIFAVSGAENLLFGKSRYNDITNNEDILQDFQNPD